MAIRITETDSQLLAEDDYGGYVIQVVTRWQIENDNWPYQVSIGLSRNAMAKVGGPRQADREQEALDEGFAIGRGAIDDLLPPPSSR